MHPLKDGTKALREVPGSVLIVLDDGKVKGVLGTMQVLKSVAEGADLSSLTCGDIMDMDVMEVNADALVSEVLKDINERQPQAVVAVDDKGSFTGYFSPNDYRQAMTKVDDNPAIRALESSVQEHERINVVLHSLKSGIPDALELNEVSLSEGMSFDATQPTHARFALRHFEGRRSCDLLRQPMEDPSVGCLTRVEPMDTILDDDVAPFLQSICAGVEHLGVLLIHEDGGRVLIDLQREDSFTERCRWMSWHLERIWMVGWDARDHDASRGAYECQARSAGIDSIRIVRPERAERSTDVLLREAELLPEIDQGFWLDASSAQR